MDPAKKAINELEEKDLDNLAKLINSIDKRISTNFLFITSFFSENKVGLAKIMNSLNEDDIAKLARLIAPLVFVYSRDFFNFTTKLDKVGIVKFAELIIVLDENGCEVFREVINFEKFSEGISGKTALANAINMLDKNSVATLATVINRMKKDDKNIVYEFVKALNSKISNSSQNNTITDLKKFIDDYKTSKLVA